MSIDRILSTKILSKLILCLFFIGIISSSVQINSYSPSWYNFQKSNQQFTLSNPLNSLKIYFKIPQNQINASSIQITKQGNWRSVYKNKNFLINIFGKEQNVLIEIQRLTKIQLQFTIKGLKEGQYQNIHIVTSTSQQNKNSNKKIGCDVTNDGTPLVKNQINCKYSLGNSKIFIEYDISKEKSNTLQLKTQLNKKDSDVLPQFLQNVNIQLDGFKQTQEFAKQMLTHTLSSLCVQQSEYEGYQFYGFCSNLNHKEIDRHYSLLIIDILFKYHSQLAAWLTQNFINLLEEKLFYSFSGRQWIHVPQHIEVFATYLKHIKENINLSESQIRKKINKLVEIQNGLLNNMLLFQVNHLSEEINYRENNKVHPTILKMLTQAWKTDLPRARVSSIYAQSFTNDFFYHQQNQKLDSSVGKMMWLIKLLNQHIMVIKNYGDSYQKQSLKQLLSLSKVMHGYVLDDPRAQNGNFNSIVMTQDVRVYTRSVGYESLLPFTYAISQVFPTTTMFNLTTSNGLSSMPLTHEKARQSYNFRGNINLYFNYKILSNMIRRCNENQKLKIFYPGLKTVIQSIKKFIINIYLESKQTSLLNFYTSWTSQGKGVASENSLAIVNLAFLQKLPPIPQKNDSQIKTKNGKKSSVK